MEQSQWALTIMLQSSQDVQSALGNAKLISAIGSGIGNNAAHELAHQFVLQRSGMDDSSTNTHNGFNCSGSTAPWVYGVGSIQWEDVTAKALAQALRAGWHQ